MKTVSTAAQLRQAITDWKRAGDSIAFVPTMGNLHAGHLHLIAQARSNATRVVASIFVNPTQFGPNEDFASYPRTLEADQQGLANAGCDLVFTPSVDTVYPAGIDKAMRIVVPPQLANMLCGRSRPGHFDGVATVVLRLLNLVQANVALFGQKDYQQLMVIQHLVQDLSLPVEIVGVETQRAPSGLALSSRNQYLTDQQRETAAQIYVTLQWMRAQVATGASPAQVCQQAIQRLTDAGLLVDYVEIRCADNLELPSNSETAQQIGLVAAKLGKARLIDNLLF